MKAASQTVRVVVDPNFGERLAALPSGDPVWVIDSPLNTPVAHRLWRERPAVDHRTGITTFRSGASESPESELLSQLQTIDLHHGEYSADPPYLVLEVFGCSPSELVCAELSEIGFSIQSTTAEGFVATRVNGAVDLTKESNS